MKAQPGGMKLLIPSRAPLLGTSIRQLRGPSCRRLTSFTYHQHHNPISTTTPNPKDQSTTPSSIDLPTQIRLLMRHVPYPVAIITSTDPSSTSSRASSPTSSSSFRGMTVSSFNTVTLTPSPIISFNVKRPSETLSALSSSGRFLVHLLAPTMKTASLARAFSKGNQNLSVVGEELGFGFAAYSPASSETESESGSNGQASPLPVPLPILQRKHQGEGEGGDFPFIFECTLHSPGIEVHDHTLVLGRIVRTVLGKSVNFERASAEELCLTYADTRFWKMGEEI